MSSTKPSAVRASFILPPEHHVRILDKNGQVTQVLHPEEKAYPRSYSVNQHQPCSTSTESLICSSNLASSKLHCMRDPLKSKVLDERDHSLNNLPHAALPAPRIDVTAQQSDVLQRDEMLNPVHAATSHVHQQTKNHLTFTTSNRYGMSCVDY